jgi:CYTH domain-containing protein
VGTEIERKYLVKDASWKTVEGVRYRQGYLNSQKERTVRVRTVGDQGFLTVKGPNVGAVRPEYEYEIPTKEANEMLDLLCEKPLIDKTRYKVGHAGLVWEIDEFHADNQGLVVAEVELDSDRTDFARPAWVGEDVTGDPKYFNSNLIKKPYTKW